jgi:hypothetical protein
MNELPSSKQEYLNLLNQKLELLLNMQSITQKAEFSGEGDEELLEMETERFVRLYERRAKLMTKIEQTDAALASYKNMESDKELARLRGSIEDKMKEAAKAVLEFDKRNMEFSSKFMLFVKGNLKKIRDGRGVNNAYTDIKGATSGYYFDKTK